MADASKDQTINKINRVRISLISDHIMNKEQKMNKVNSRNVFNNKIITQPLRKHKLNTIDGLKGELFNTFYTTNRGGQDSTAVSLMVTQDSKTYGGPVKRNNMLRQAYTSYK